jgi:hypothetical protein
MNPNEKEMLENFLKQLKATQTVQKDSEANELIVESTKPQADAGDLSPACATPVRQAPDSIRVVEAARQHAVDHLTPKTARR